MASCMTKAGVGGPQDGSRVCPESKASLTDCSGRANCPRLHGLKGFHLGLSPSPLFSSRVQGIHASGAWL